MLEILWFMKHFLVLYSVYMFNLHFLSSNLTIRSSWTILMSVILVIFAKYDQVSWIRYWSSVDNWLLWFVVVDDACCLLLLYEFDNVVIRCWCSNITRHTINVNFFRIWNCEHLCVCRLEFDLALQGNGLKRTVECFITMIN